MKYVLDASVAVASLLNEPDSAAANALLDDYKQQAHALIAPDILPAEMAHALTKAERKGIIRVGDASVLLGSFLRMPPVLHSHRIVLSRAVDLSSQFRIGFYDCLYVALAESENCRVVTLDVRLVKKFPAIVIHLSAV